MKSKILFYLLLIIPFSSCTSNKLDIDTSKVELNLKIDRFEKDLFAINPDFLAKEIPSLRNKYKFFFELFCGRIIRVGASTDSLLAKNLKGFVTDPQIQQVYKDCSTQYSDISDINDPLTKAFQHYKYYFPEKLIPQIVTFISGFNYSIIYSDSILGIGLDMYLGESSKYYSQIGFPKYKTMKMRKEFIVADCMKGWGQSTFEQDNSKKDFLSQIIYSGKMLYFMDAMLPDTPDSIKIGYTSDQLKFCKKNEAKIWSLFIEKNLLFSTDQSKFAKYINEGPTTNGLPKESPAMLGAWVGWQMVKKYMNDNSGMTLKQLMLEHDAQKILTKSKYKPSK